MQRFPDAFIPIVGSYVKKECKVYKLENVDDGVKVHWKEGTNEDDIGDIYDRVIVTCPFSVVRQWELPG